MKKLSNREAGRRREQRAGVDPFVRFLASQYEYTSAVEHARKVRRRVVRLLTWSAVVTFAFVAYAVVQS